MGPRSDNRSSAFVIAVSIAIVGTAFLACGLTVTGSPAEPASTESPSNPAGTSNGAAEPPESRGTTFACGGGGATCTTGVDICCEETPGVFACRAIDAGGCPASADGGQPTSALACTTYNACPGYDECCYNPTTRSSTCKSRCEQNEASLCRLGSDRCGQSSECEQLNNPPAPGIGECRYSGGNSNSNSSNGYPGYPGGGGSSRGW